MAALSLPRSFRPADVLGILSGAPTANAGAAAAVASGQAKVRSYADKLGTVLGGSLGSGVFDALSHGAQSGESKKNDAVARETIGLSVASLKSLLIAAAVAVVALGVFLGRASR